MDRDLTISTWLDDEQVRTLALSLGLHRGDQGFTGEELQRVLDWAEEVLLTYGLLQAVFCGHVAVSVATDGEVMFRLTDAGTEYVERDLLGIRE